MARAPTGQGPTHFSHPVHVAPSTVNTFSSTTHYRRIIEVDVSGSVKSGTLMIRSRMS